MGVEDLAEERVLGLDTLRLVFGTPLAVHTGCASRADQLVVTVTLVDEPLAVPDRFDVVVELELAVAAFLVDFPVLQLPWGLAVVCGGENFREGEGEVEALGRKWGEWMADNSRD